MDRRHRDMPALTTLLASCPVPRGVARCHAGKRALSRHDVREIESKHLALDVCVNTSRAQLCDKGTGINERTRAHGGNRRRLRQMCRVVVEEHDVALLGARPHRRNKSPTRPQHTRDLSGPRFSVDHVHTSYSGRQARRQRRQRRQGCFPPNPPAARDCVTRDSLRAFRRAPAFQR